MKTTRDNVERGECESIASSIVRRVIIFGRRANVVLCPFCGDDILLIHNYINAMDFSPCRDGCGAVVLQERGDIRVFRLHSLPPADRNVPTPEIVGREAVAEIREGFSRPVITLRPKINQK